MDVPINEKQKENSMVISKEEILEQIKNKIGDSVEDADIKLLEDISDTLDDLNDKVANSGDWKTKYEENDKAWKEKYRDRFYNAEAKDDVDKFQQKKEMELENEEPKKLTFDALFSSENN